MELKNVAGKLEVSKVVTESYSIYELEKQKHVLEDQLAMVNRNISVFTSEARKIEAKIYDLDVLLTECDKLSIKPVSINPVEEIL